MARNATPIPAVIPDDSWDRTICIPASPLFLAIVAGILKSLTYRYFWQGTPEQIDAVTERMTRMFYEYQDQNGDCMDWCQIIADCINDPNSPASQALRDQFGGNGYPIGTNLPNGKQNANFIAATNPTCDLDVLYGQCVYLIRTCNQLVVDFLERLDAINTAELSVELVSRFPIIDEMGGDVVIAYAQFLADAIPENYMAQYDTALEINMACGLFCIAKDTCELSINDVADYFAGRLGVSLTAVTLEELLTALLGASLDGDYVVMAFYTLIWKGLALANTILGNRGDSVLNNALKLGAGDPSDDWIINCEDCSTPTWSQTFNFTSSNGGWSSAYSGTNWVSGEGWSYGIFAGASLIRITRTVAMREVTSITLTFGGITLPFTPQAFCYNGGTQTINDNFRTISSTGTVVVPMIFTSPQDVTNYELGLNTIGNVIDSTARLTAITITGNGVNPFI